MGEFSGPVWGVSLFRLRVSDDAKIFGVKDFAAENEFHAAWAGEVEELMAESWGRARSL